MLILPIKKKWFDMILAGEKKEEYREIKPYYMTRFANIGLLNMDLDSFNYVPTGNVRHVIFRNGYSGDSPSFAAKCVLSIGTGKPEWGAEPGKEYYVLKIVNDMDEVLLFEYGNQAERAMVDYLQDHPGLKIRRVGGRRYVELEDKTRLWFLEMSSYRTWCLGRTYVLNGHICKSGWLVARTQ